jgi:hypothetical protein
MRTIRRFTAAIACVGVAAALAAAAPAQARDTADLTSAQSAQTSVAPAATSELVTHRSCVPATDPAQVRTCVYLYKDGPEFAGRAMITDLDGGRNYDVLTVNLRIQGYVNGQWQLVSNTWNADEDGWHSVRDNVEHEYVLTCHGAGGTIPLRTAATFRYKLAGADQRTTVTRYSPAARTYCP